MSIIDSIARNIVNIPGWSTQRKIVVFESDDWGSIRMPSGQARKELIRLGFPIQHQSFNMLDALESNDDLIDLFDLLKKHKDSTGRHPVFTAVSIVANPNFEKIKTSDYQQYYYEPFTETLNHYPNHDKVIDLYKQGISERLFVPVFHGREHLNVKRWLKALQSGNKAVRTTFDHRVTAIHIGPNNEFIGDFQAAFDLDSSADLPYMKATISEGLDLFENLWGYKSEYFVPTNGPFNNSLEQVLADKGVKYILAERLQNEPIGDSKFKKHIHYLGMKNKLNQTYITRNAAFEPAIVENELNINPMENCMKSIERAFRWGKPATVSTHRVNYIGSIDQQNRNNNLVLLDKLLAAIIQRWPEVEFMTSVELGKLMQQRK